MATVVWDMKILFVRKVFPGKPLDGGIGQVDGQNRPEVGSRRKAAQTLALWRPSSTADAERGLYIIIPIAGCQPGSSTPPALIDNPLSKW